MTAPASARRLRGALLRWYDANRRELPWRPGARELLESIGDAGVPCVLVTLSWRRFAEAVIDAAPDGVFAGSITGDEVERGKPAPDPYLAAAELLGVDPGRCVAIEDSPTGAASALAAGCRTIAGPHVVDVPPRAGLTIWSSLDGVTVDDLRAIVPA